MTVSVINGIEEICEEYGLLNDGQGLVGIPFLVKGRLAAPPIITLQQAEDAFRNVDKDTAYIRLPEAQIIREPVIRRKQMKATVDYIYLVMPGISADELIETDIDKLVRGPYALTVDEILEYLESIISTLVNNPNIVMKILELYRSTNGFPEIFLDNLPVLLSTIFSRGTARQMIDNELSLWGKPGSEFLNGWVEIPSRFFPGSTISILASENNPAAKPLIRAMPTRQLHITAGNAPEAPLASIIRAVLTKSAAVVKLPSEAVLTGALFTLAAVATAPEHPLTKNMSVVYWPGGDSNIEKKLFRTGAFDRIVVWGSPETVISVQSQARFTRTVFFNPRYGVSLIGREAFSDNLEEIITKAAADVMIYNQQACTASLVQYVEGNDEQIEKYAWQLQTKLAQYDEQAPGIILPRVIGKVKNLRRGQYSQAQWYLNEKDSRFTSGVVVVRGEFDVLDHPMSRLVVIRPVADLNDALPSLDQNVSTVGVFPESKRNELRDRIAGRGVSDILPLGECSRTYSGMPHDGMPVLSELVDWKNA